MLRDFLGHYKIMSLEKGIGYTHHVPAPCKDEVKVLYADDDIVLVDKPAGPVSYTHLTLPTILLV